VWQQSEDIFVLVRPSLNINPISSAATNGLSNGSAGVLVTGGSSPVYAYSWSNGATTPIIAGVLSGSYNVTVTDGFCPQSISVVVSNTIVTSGILRGEYFWDGVDPGPGNGTDILLTQGSPINSFANVPTTGLAAGYHVLSVRMIDFQEEWGFVRNLPVYISPVQTPPISELPNVTEVEYFFDNIDPGVSNASSLTLSVQDTLISESYAISCSLLGPGNHKISMRVKDATGKWGITKTATFNTCFPPPAPPLTLNALGDTINTAEVCLGSNHNFIAQTSPYSLRWTSPNGQQTHVGNNWYRFSLGLQDTGYYWVQALGSEPGCYSEPSLYHLTILEAPEVTETVSGLQVVCPYDGPQAYFINPIENAVFYTWNMPTGAALLTGNNTNNASITFEDVIASSGSISVTAANQCGSSNSGILALNFPCVEEDYDGDGVMNLIDNCFLTANTNQLDADTDGVGDVCDNCPLYSNADQTFAVLYQDADGDGFGNSSITIMGCPGAPGTATVAGDCDDANALMHDLFNFYFDTDGDGYGAGTALIPQCAQSAVLPPAGYSAVNTDCAYANPAVNPGVSESCGNSIDDNCNGEINEGCTSVTPGDEPTAAIPSININQYGTGVQWSSAADLTIGTNSNQSMGTGNDLWFQFIAQNNAVRISLKGSTVVNDDNDLALYNSTTNWNTVLIPIATENDVHPASLGISTDGGNEILYYDQLVVGQTYYICVRNNNSTPGSCILTISYLKGSQADIGA